MAGAPGAALESAVVIRVDVDCRRGAFHLEARFEVPARGFTAVFGASGAGKSTLLDLIGGSLRPDRGLVAVGERIFVDTHRGILLPAERRAIGWVPQDGLLFPHLDVAGNEVVA